VNPDLHDDLSRLIAQNLSPDESQVQPGQRVRWRAAKMYLSGSALLFGIVSLLLLLSRSPTEPLMGLAAPALSLLIALISSWAFWKQPRRWIDGLVLTQMALIMGLAVAVSVSHDLGLYTAGLELMGLMVALAGSMMWLRGTIMLAIVAAAVLAALAWAELNGWATSPVAIQSVWVRLVTQLLLLLGALMVGLGTQRMVQRAVGEASERETRFRGLLSMAADWYWEMDRDYRFTHVGEEKPGSSGLDLQARLGKTPWEVDVMGMSDEALDAHRADLESHRMFTGLVARRTGADGGICYVSISGAPRFDRLGNFRGYWGVGRNVTHEMHAQQAIHATESRYRELFRRSPSPLVLHRLGRVLDANPAAMAMFGYTQRSSMLGQDLFSHYEPGDDEHARAGEAKIAAMAVGAVQAMAEYRLRTLSRQVRRVSATSTRVNANGGPATLTFFVDQTDTSLAQEALRRSEGLLSHLVATSPDVITLTDMPTGRFAMVNKTFELLTGFSKDEVMGRTATEIGIWRDAESRVQMLETVRIHGRVTDQPVTFVNKSGAPISMLVSAAPFSMDGQTYLVINARDVSTTERNRLIQEAILDNASIGIALTRDRCFVQANKRVEAMFGWAAGTLVGQPGSVVWGDAADYEAVGRDIGARLASGEQVETERPMRRHDGSSFLCRLLAKAVDPTHPSQGGTIWIMEDVTERRRVEAALAQAKDAAQAASRAKSAFLANTSHEIRTPLNGLLGLARLLQQPDLPDVTRRDYLDQMLDSAESLSGLIADILDLSKIEAGRLTLEAAPFGLRDLLTAMRTAYLTLAHARGLAFRVEVAPAVPAWVVGDVVRTRQIIANFLTNALKFTEAGAVQMRVLCPRSELLRIEVIDTGPGIDISQQERLFEPFTQADESTTRRYGGTGLGLSICRELADLMGGTVGLNSALGEGSTFWAELPLVAAPTPAPPPERMALIPAAKGASPAPLNAELQGKRVLMVEDHPVNMMIAVAQLEAWELEVGQASNGEQAVHAVLAAANVGRPFDAVLMDLQMPVMSGHEAARLLRGSFSAEQLPIIALTAAALISEREEALAAGMNDFLTKPIDAPKLRQALVRWIGR
jgi:PAS domain S-box-containing protein